MTEQELVARAKAGDQSAFEQLVLDNQKRIYTLCLRMTGDPGDGEHLAQEAFLHAWRGLPSFQGDSSFSTWVYRLASNVCLDFLRKRKRRQNVEGGPSVDDQDSGWTEPSDPVQDPEGALLRQEVQRAVEQGLATLPDHHRQVLVMRALSGMTYQDFISSLFSWTSRLPQRQINVFIRGKTLHIIQRGHEGQVTDITDWPHTMPTISRKLIRSVWDSATTEGWDKAKSDKDYEPQPFTGTIGIEGITRHYLNGLLMEEETNGSFTEYSYDDQYLTEKRTHNPDGSTVQTTYTYAKTANDIYLFKETEKTTDATQKEGETSHDRNDWTDWLNENFSTRITYHAPIGYGWYSTTVYEDGEFQGSSISQGKPGGKSSQFIINEWNRSLGSDYDFNDDEDDKFKGQALFDTEFPVTGDDFLRELTHEIEWLNRKRQEEVSLDIVSPVIKGHATIRHILDFTERIRLDGKEYFLVSNQVKLTTRSLRQSIRLVRWYG